MRLAEGAKGNFGCAKWRSASRLPEMSQNLAAAVRDSNPTVLPAAPTAVVALVSAALTSTRSHERAGMKSASVNATHLPPAARQPAFRAVAAPPLLLQMTWTPNDSATSDVASVDPSSTTMTSTSRRGASCPHTARKHLPRVFSALYAGMTTLTEVISARLRALPYRGTHQRTLWRSCATTLDDIAKTRVAGLSRYVKLAPRAR